MRARPTVPRIIIAAVVMTGAAAAMHATTVVPPTFDELVARSQTVFVGQTLDVRSQGISTSSGPAIVTLVTFKVLRTLNGELNGRNDLFFGTDMHGKAFGNDTLALTTWWYRGNALVEGDIGFNSAKNWNSYRGNTRYASRRSGRGETLPCTTRGSRRSTSVMA